MYKKCALSKPFCVLLRKMLAKIVVTDLTGIKYRLKKISFNQRLNPLSPNSDLSQMSQCSIGGLVVREVMRIEDMITHVKFC